MPKYKFEEIAVNCTVKKVPNDEDNATYIGLEHLDSDSIYVKRCGSDVPLKGEKLVMHKGDVLLGKRNAYLRRAAIAPHDGIFSAHGMVLNPKEDVVDKDFFPLFIASDYFFDEAIRISVGSLSPTINWSDLRKLEFTLPEMDEQRKMSKILWSIIDTIEVYKDLLKLSDDLVKSQFNEIFGDINSNTNNYPIMPLSSIADYYNGLTYSPKDVTDNSGILVLRSSNIQNGNLCFDDNVYVKCLIKEKQYVKNGDILMCSRNGSSKLVGKVALIDNIEKPMSFGAFMMIIRSRHSRFLKTYFESDTFKNQINTGTATINQITGGMLNALSIPVPPIEDEIKFKKVINLIDKSKFEIVNSINELRKLYQKLIKESINR